MKRLVLVLIGVLAAIGLWYASKSLGEGSETPAEAGAASIEDEVSPADVEQPVALDEEPVALVGVDQAAEEPARSTAPDADELDLTTARYARVTAVLPTGTPADEALEIWAWRDQPNERELAGDLTAAHSHDLIGKTTPETDGTFEVAFPDEVERGWLYVRGRYAFSLNAVAIDLTRPEPEIALDLVLGAWVCGTVVVPDGVAAADVDGLEIDLEPNPLAAAGGAVNPFLGRVIEREAEVHDLAFEYRGVSPGPEFSLQVVPDELAAYKSEPFDLEPGGRYDFEIRLMRGGRIVGRVVDPAGQPVEGADVDAQQHPIWFGTGGIDVRSALSGDDGRFELDAVAAGETTLEVEADGFIEAYEKLTVVDQAEHGELLIELSAGARISGRVTFEDGTVAADAEVGVRFDIAGAMGMGGFNAATGASGSARTDESGHFVVTGLGNGPFTVESEALPPGAAEDDETWTARRNGVDPDTEGLELVLLPPVGLSGQVVDLAGEPVESFSVTVALLLENSPIQGIGIERQSESFDDPEGAFRFPRLDRGHFSVRADAEGYASSAPIEVPVPQDEELVITLEPAARVAGTVLGPDGLPFPGADVTLALDLQDLIQSRTGQLDVPETTTDGEGRFLLDGLRRGSANLVARSADTAESAPVGVELVAGETTADVVLALRRGARLTGEVYADGGEPAGGVQVIVQTTAGQHQRIVQTAGDGTFEIDHMTPESYQVIAMMSDLSELGTGGETPDAASMLANMKMKMVTLADEEELHVVLGAPPEFPVVVTGRVTVDGRGLDGLFVQFIPHGQDSLGGMKLATTRDGGEYELQLDAPGTYQIAISRADVSGTSRNSIEYTEDVPSEDEAQLDFELPIGRITGRVEGGGKPLAKARVTLTEDGPVRSGTLIGGHYVDTQTDEDGFYEIDWVRPGTYTLAAGGSTLGGLFGDDPAGFGRQVRAGLEVRENEELGGIDFELRKPGAITGSVVDGAGRPMPEVTIFVETADGAALERFSFVSSDASGRFRYGGLAPGRYRVGARGAGHASEERVAVQVRSDEDSEVELVVTSGATLIVTIVDQDGEPLQVDLVVRDEDDHQVNGQLSIADLTEAFQGGEGFSLTDERVGPLPPGRYRIEATAMDGRTARKLVRVRAGEGEQRVTVKVRE